MILVCGATGDLGGRITRLLIKDGRAVRALVRPATDATQLQGNGVQVIRGDLRDDDSLRVALSGIDTVVTTANGIGRILAGPTDLTIAGVDGQGNQNLIRAAAEAGVDRFVFVSAAGMGEELSHHGPFTAAKWAAEKALRATSMRVVIVRPDMLQEVWLAPATGINPAAGKALIYGRGTTPHAYVATDDTAALCAHLAVDPDPPALVEFGGPERLTRMQVVAAFEAATGRKLRVQHVPDAMLAIGQRALARIRPELASIMGMALWFDTRASTWDDEPLRRVGVTPRPASAFITQEAMALAF